MTQKVLVVDDEAMILDLLEIVLGREGYQVTRAASGEEAIELLATEDFALVITDLQMSGISGLAVVAAAKHNSPDTVAIVLTGCFDKQYETAAYGSGADDYLHKPFSLTGLRKSIHLHDPNFCPVGQRGKRPEVSA